jgi:hypothetical protein
VLLFLFGSRKGGSREAPPKYNFPPSPAATTNYSAAPPPAWVPYAPLTPEVIARAEQILHDRNAHQLIENDPSHPGLKVRYLRTTDNPPGHTSVTAWMPNPNAPHLAPA